MRTAPNSCASSRGVRPVMLVSMGSRIRRRRYGSEVPELIDQPLNSATIVRIGTAIFGTRTYPKEHA